MNAQATVRKILNGIGLSAAVVGLTLLVAAPAEAVTTPRSYQSVRTIGGCKVTGTYQSFRQSPTTTEGFSASTTSDCTGTPYTKDLVSSTLFCRAGGSWFRSRAGGSIAPTRSQAGIGSGVTTVPQGKISFGDYCYSRHGINLSGAPGGNFEYFRIVPPGVTPPPAANEASFPAA